MSMGKSKKRLGMTKSKITPCNSKRLGTTASTMTPCNSKKTRIGTATPAKSSFPRLPDELILYNVLTRLPIKSLRRFSCVSKLWCGTITGEQAVFNASHLIRSKRNPIILSFLREVKGKKVIHWSSYNFLSIDGEFSNSCSYFCYRSKGRTSVIGECNGLFCIRSSSGVEVCNLSTHEVLILPPPPPPASLRSRIIYGFGFEILNSEYKVVQLVDGKSCSVFTLGGTNSWRDITLTLPADVTVNLNRYSQNMSVYLSNGALYSSGYLYWLVISEHKLVSFNIQTEKLFLIPCPYYHPGTFDHFLFEFHDRPCVGYPDLCSSVAIEMNLFCLVKDPHCDSHTWKRQTIKIPTVFPDTYVFSTSFLCQGITCWLDDDFPNSLIIFDFISLELSMVKVPLHKGYNLLQVGLIFHIENLHSLKNLVHPDKSAGQVQYIQMPK